jgi:hypothetical protein
LFGLTKKRIGTLKKAAKCNAQSQDIVRIIRACQSEAVTNNVVARFRNAGISLIDVVDDQKIPFPLSVVTLRTMRCCNQVHDRHLQKLTIVLEGTDDEDEEPTVDTAGGD